MVFFLAGTVWAVEPLVLAQQHFQSGLAYERLGRLAEAYTELQLAVNLDPENAQVSLAVGLVASRLGNMEKAQYFLERSISIDAGSCASYYQLALLYEKKDLADRANESWQRFYGLTQDTALKAVAQKHIQNLEGRP
jgi:tetratricopeptide (TPR) repeat protein